jgi:hypothetical protein
MSEVTGKSKKGASLNQLAIGNKNPRKRVVLRFTIK